MDFSNLAVKRESVRRYSDRPVEQEKIIRIMESCRMAPSACNSQPWHFVVVTDGELKDKVAHACFSTVLQFNKFAVQAPVIVALVAEKANWLSKLGSSIKDKDLYLIDIGIVADHFCLQAADLDLGTCMLGWFDEPMVKKLLQIPSGKRIPLLFTLGYPEKDNSRSKTRKDINEIFSFNKY